MNKIDFTFQRVINGWAIYSEYELIAVFEELGGAYGEDSEQSLLEWLRYELFKLEVTK